MAKFYDSDKKKHAYIKCSLV